MVRHELPSGNWIELKDPTTLTRGNRKRLIMSVSDMENQVQASYEMMEGLLTVLVTGWSYQLPLPSIDPASLDELPFEDDDPLTKIVMEIVTVLFPGKPSPDDAADPKAPTAD